MAVLEEHLFFNPRSIGGHIDKLSSMKRYLELVLPSGDVIRAHPKYHSKQQWYSWCFVDWNAQHEPVPVLVLMIVDFTDLVIATTGTAQLGVTLYLTKDPFVVVQFAYVSDSGANLNSYRLAGKLCKQLVMEQKWSLIPASAIVGPAYDRRPKEHSFRRTKIFTH